MRQFFGKTRQPQSPLAIPSVRADAFDY